MNGIRLLLLLAAAAQVEPGTERDYGWSVNKLDGVLEYIVQINTDEVRAMEQRSVKYPNGQENVSNMPRELVGRASRVVTRVGNEILPREPSLQDLERTPRLFEQPNPSATALLGPGRLQELESNVHNIQGSAPALPEFPNGLGGAQGQTGVGNDRFGQASNTLRDDPKESLSDAFPDSNMLAQNLSNNQSGASGFLNDTRGAAAGASSRFNNTAQPAVANPAANPSANPPSSMPAFPPAVGANSTLATNPYPGSTNSKSSGLGNGTQLGSNPSALNYPDPRLNPPSLNSPLPQQQTPSSGFGTTPGLAGRPANNWAATSNPAPATYDPRLSQPYDSYAGTPNYSPSYTSAPNPGTYPLHVATNAPNPALANSSTQTGRPPQTAASGGVAAPPISASGGQITATNVDGILQVLFLLSLVVNFYLGILIRKLLIRYRSLLTNVRSQTAYT